MTDSKEIDVLNRRICILREKLEAAYISGTDKQKLFQLNTEIHKLIVQYQKKHE